MCGMILDYYSVALVINHAHLLCLPLSKFLFLSPLAYQNTLVVGWTREVFIFLSYAEVR